MNKLILSPKAYCAAFSSARIGSSSARIGSSSAFPVSLIDCTAFSIARTVSSTCSSAVISALPSPFWTPYDPNCA